MRRFLLVMLVQFLPTLMIVVVSGFTTTAPPAFLSSSVTRRQQQQRHRGVIHPSQQQQQRQSLFRLWDLPPDRQEASSSSTDLIFDEEEAMLQAAQEEAQLVNGQGDRNDDDDSSFSEPAPAAKGEQPSRASMADLGFRQVVPVNDEEEDVTQRMVVMEEEEEYGKFQVEEREQPQQPLTTAPEPLSLSQQSLSTTTDRFPIPLQVVPTNGILAELDKEEQKQNMLEEQQQRQDEMYMRLAIQLAESAGDSAYPNPAVGAVLVNTAASTARTGAISREASSSSLTTSTSLTGAQILGMARSDYNQDAVLACLEDAGLDITPLREWLVAWPESAALRQALTSSATTLYVTLEPSRERRGQVMPPITQLIQQSGIGRVVIGCADPVPERARKGAATLHAAGVEVKMGGVLQEECENLIRGYGELANSKLHAQARKHFQLFGRPLGFLHCSVVDSDNLEAFARHGNAFGTMFGGKTLSFRNFGAYEIAPPPEVIWADNTRSDSDFDDDSLFSVDFEDEDFQGDIRANNPMTPWYEQVDAVVATFPGPGNGPSNDDSIAARLNGLRWLATHGSQLPPGVERILVMDATDLKDLPLTNEDAKLLLKTTPGSTSSSALSYSYSSSPMVSNSNNNVVVDVESFWKGEGRKPTRVLLRRGEHAQARAAASAAAHAAEAAAQAANVAAEALESGDASRAAEAALEWERAARAETEYIQTQLQTLQTLRGKLESLGVTVETINGGEPVDVMQHLGDRNGYRTVVWRAGCWGNRGVKSILAGAFQWVSAHLAVDAVGGKFWQLMLAENCVQCACGPSSKVKVFAGQDDISLEYCDQPDMDTDCNLTIEGRPVRHIRLDCRIALVDENRPREFVIAKTKKLDRKIMEEEAPWFL